MTRAQWRSLAIKRLKSVLSAHIVANERTLEQKISDAGPNNQRVEPHIITAALRMMEAQGEVLVRIIDRTPWYYLKETPIEDVDQRLTLLSPLYDATQDGAFLTRLGQALEIAVYKALLRYENAQQFLGHFTDLEQHGEDLPFTKVDPPMTIGRMTLRKGRLDYVAFGYGGPAAIEVKNYRMWLYPDREQIRELFRKSCEIEAVPVLIARRFPYLTFQFLKYSGAIVHQTYNQLYLDFDRELGMRARDKRLLGYHDIRFGTDPDARLLKFIGTHLPNALPEARLRFNALKTVHDDYAHGRTTYQKWFRTVLTARGIWSDEGNE